MLLCIAKACAISLIMPVVINLPESFLFWFVCGFIIALYDESNLKKGAII